MVVAFTTNYNYIIAALDVKFLQMKISVTYKYEEGDTAKINTGLNQEPGGAKQINQNLSGIRQID